MRTLGNYIMLVAYLITYMNVSHQWYLGCLLASYLEKVAFYWSFMPEISVEFANLLANEMQARLADEISPTLLTNKKPGD